MSGSRGAAGGGGYRARAVSLQISTKRSWLSGVWPQPQKGLQQATEVKHLRVVPGVTCQTPRDAPSIPKSRCKAHASMSAEIPSWGPSEQNQLGSGCAHGGHSPACACGLKELFQPCLQAWLLDLPWGHGLPAPCSNQPGSFGGACALSWAKQGFCWFRVPGGPLLSCCGR